MLEGILYILSIIGIILLVLLIVILVILLLVLFFPITYRFYGSKSEDISIQFRTKWLFGFFRVHYLYPDPAIFKIKVLWHTLYQKKIPSDNHAEDAETQISAKERDTRKSSSDSASQKETTAKRNQENASVSLHEEVSCESVSGDETVNTNKDASVENTAESLTDTSSNKILKKIEKIKYTILNIYDKIKEIWKNISYYADLIQEQNTKVLFQHVTMRVGKIFKSIRPRHLKANIVLGTGSPDTTGYAYGLYGMLSAALGPEFIVVPDFEQAILRGELQFSGHITIWVLLINALKLFFDPKLHLFIEKFKAGMPKKNEK